MKKMIDIAWRLNCYCLSVCLSVCPSVMNWVVHVNRKLASWGIIIHWFFFPVREIGWGFQGIQIATSWEQGWYIMLASNYHWNSPLQQSTLYRMLFTFSQECCLPFPRDVVSLSPGMKCLPFLRNVFFPRFRLPFPSDVFYCSLRMLFSFPKDVVKPSPRMLFSLPQGCCSPFPTDIVYLSSGMLFVFPRDVVYLSSGMLFIFPQGFPRDVIYLSPGWIPSRFSWFTSFPKCKVTLRLLVSWILAEFACSQKWKNINGWNT